MKVPTGGDCGKINLPHKSATVVSAKAEIVSQGEIVLQAKHADLGENPKPTVTVRMEETNALPF